MPPNTVKVDRATRWGNPYICKGPQDRLRATTLFSAYCDDPDQSEFVAAVRSELRGKDLACWCPLTEACHGDILLQIANSCI